MSQSSGISYRSLTSLHNGHINRRTRVISQEVSSMADKALSAYRVLELGEGVSAAYCTKLMADLGAEVIKIEEPGIGDSSRSAGPFPGDVPHPDKSGLF